MSKQRFMEFEDTHEQEKKDLQNHVDRMESHSRQLELKIKNYSDQSEWKLHTLQLSTYIYAFPFFHVMLVLMLMGLSDSISSPPAAITPIHTQWINLQRQKVFFF